MTRDEAVAIVCQRLGGNRTDLADRARSEMALAQVELEGGVFMPWFLEQTSDIALAANASSVALPVRFLREMGDDNDGGLAYVQANGRLSWLTRVGNRKAAREYGQAAEGVGAPQAYALGKSTLEIFPAANIAYTLRYTYYGMDEEQSIDIENGWLRFAPDILIAKTCLMLAEHIVSMEVNVAAFDRDYNRAMKRLHVNHEARMNEGRTFELGET